MKIKAAILVEQKQPLVIDEVEVPKLDFGQVLVDIKVSRICGSQIGEIDGVKGPDRWLPHLLGHEAGGVVLEVGPCVKHVKPGDRIVAHWRPGLGINAPCPQYQWANKTVNAGNITTFSEKAIISENRLTVVPEDLDFELCALLADTLTTGIGVITRDAKVRVGQSVLVVGGGAGIGLGAVLGASLAGAHPIIVADLQQHKLDVASEYGATHCINCREVDLTEAVREIVGDYVDVAIDGTGNPSVIEQLYNLTNPTGKTVLFGVMSHEKTVSIHTLPLHFGRTLTGSEGGQSIPQYDIPRYVKMMQSGCFDPKGFVSHRFQLEEVNQAIAGMRSGEVIHAMIHFS